MGYGNVYGVLHGSVSYTNGEWVYDYVSLGGKSYCQDTFVSATKTSGGSYYTYCKSRNTFRNPNTGLYSFNASFYAADK